MKILETERLTIREFTAATDAGFVLDLLNSPKFIQYIGDRGVRTAEDARAFIETRYRQSYLDNGFGLYAVERKIDNVSIGLCGFVKRDTLPGPDIGFAFLPEFEGGGYGFESAEAVMKYGRDTLGFTQILAITSQDNAVSGRLLEKLGFKFARLIESGDETLKLFAWEN